MRHRPDDERLRRRAHLTLTCVFAAIVVGVDAIGSQGVINTIYTLVSYTYGPLLGLFAYALACPWRSDTKKLSRRAPLLAVAAPLLSYSLSALAALYGYHFSYELLMLNGCIMFLGLLLTTGPDAPTQADTSCHLPSRQRPHRKR